MNKVSRQALPDKWEAGELGPDREAMKQALELGKDLECDISVELAKKYVLPSLILCPWLELPEL